MKRRVGKVVVVEADGPGTTGRSRLALGPSIAAIACVVLGAAVSAYSDRWSTARTGESNVPIGIYAWGVVVVALPGAIGFGMWIRRRFGIGPPPKSLPTSMFWAVLASIGWLNTGSMLVALARIAHRISVIGDTRDILSEALDFVLQNQGVGTRIVAAVIVALYIALIVITVVLLLIAPYGVGRWLGGGAWRRTRWAAPESAPRRPLAPMPVSKHWLRRRLLTCALMAIALPVALIYQLSQR